MPTQFIEGALNDSIVFSIATAAELSAGYRAISTDIDVSSRFEILKNRAGKFPVRNAEALIEPHDDLLAVHADSMGLKWIGFGS